MSLLLDEIVEELRNRVNTLGIKTDGDEEDTMRLRKHARHLQMHRNGEEQDIHILTSTTHGHLYENHKNNELEDDIMSRVARQVVNVFMSRQFSISNLLGQSPPVGLFISKEGVGKADLDTLRAALVGPKYRCRINANSTILKMQSKSMIYKLWEKAESDSSRFILAVCATESKRMAILVDVITPYSLYIYHAIQ